MRYGRFYVSGTSYYICIKFIYIKKYHVIVSSKVVQFFFEKDVHWLNKSKRKEKKRFPRNINLTISCPIFILQPRDLHKSNSQSNLHPKSGTLTFYRSRCPLASKPLNIVSFAKSWKSSRANSSITKPRQIRTFSSASFSWDELPEPGLGQLPPSGACVAIISAGVATLRVCALPRFSSSSTFPIKSSMRTTVLAAGFSHTAFPQILPQVRPGSMTTTRSAACASKQCRQQANVRPVH